ncbi:MAG: hypothetical protein JRG89_14020 [Deltaproteobacteria bacterium]|nr:hypothetical protein [Deltaproteobacteria bacterium]
MGRSKLRGVEIAGVKLAIEVPSNLPWQWPNEQLRSLACGPIDPDVHIGVRVARPRRPHGETYHYESRGVRFEIGWEGENWVVGIFGEDGCQRTARFDADFRHGEIVVSPECAAEAAYPLEHPLDELILLHRLTREGCVVMNGSVSLQDGEALLFLESGRSEQTEMLGGVSDSRLISHVVLRPVLERDAISDTQIWVHSTPWRNNGNTASWHRAPLAAIHILSPDGDRPLERLTDREAECELLNHVFAPIHDPQAADRLFDVVARVVRRTSVLSMTKPRMKREVSFNWDLPQAGLGFASPSL